MTTTAQHAIRWLHSLDEALRQSAQQGKPVLLDFFSPTWGGCQRLEAVTYPDPAVASLISEQTIPAQIATHDPGPDEQKVIQRYLQVWTPTIMLLSPEGAVYDDWNGFLPPSLFVPRLKLGLGKVALKQGKYEEAARRFDEIHANHPFADVAPESMYWAAVARYRGSGNGQDLMQGWEKLRSRYPESVWRIKQSFTELPKA